MHPNLSSLCYYEQTWKKEQFFSLEKSFEWRSFDTIEKNGQACIHHTQGQQKAIEMDECLKENERMECSLNLN